MRGGTVGTLAIIDSGVAQTFTMLTINADDHELMKHHHRPDPRRPLDKQDKQHKRMLVLLPSARYQAWRDAPVKNSMNFTRHDPAKRLVPPPQPAAVAAKKARVVRTERGKADPSSGQGGWLTQRGCTAALAGLRRGGFICPPNLWRALWITAGQPGFLRPRLACHGVPAD